MFMQKDENNLQLILSTHAKIMEQLSALLRNAQTLDIFKRMLLNHYPTTNVPP